MMNFYCSTQGVLFCLYSLTFVCYLSNSAYLKKDRTNFTLKNLHSIGLYNLNIKILTKVSFSSTTAATF